MFNYRFVAACSADKYEGSESNTCKTQLARISIPIPRMFTLGSLCFRGTLHSVSHFVTEISNFSGSLFILFWGVEAAVTPAAPQSLKQFR